MYIYRVGQLYVWVEGSSGINAKAYVTAFQ